MGKLVDILLILCLVFGIYKIGKFQGGPDAYYLGVLAGYDLFYKVQYEQLLDSLKNVPACK